MVASTRFLDSASALVSARPDQCQMSTLESQMPMNLVWQTHDHVIG